jgi:aspartyl-tRNA(Asn)/glutamyl-tRNA(Gln) amidotransferase subunit C
LAIDPGEARRIARLARLDLEDAEAETLARQLEAVLHHVAALDELDLGEGERSDFDAAPCGPLREDDTRDGLDSEEALRNAPDPASGCFRVPRSLPE